MKTNYFLILMIIILGLVIALEVKAADLKTDTLKAVMAYPRVKDDIKYNQGRLQRKLNLTDNEVTGIIVTARLAEGNISSDGLDTEVVTDYGSITPTFRYNWKTNVGKIEVGLKWGW